MSFPLISLLRHIRAQTVKIKRHEWPDYQRRNFLGCHIAAG